MPAKNTIEDIKTSFEEERYTLLTEEYKNQNQKLEYVCTNNHKSSTTWKNWKKGNRCRHCSSMTKLNMEDVAKEFLEDGYTLLSKDTYKNTSQKLNYKCPEGHEHSITLRDWRSGYRCPYCAGNRSLDINYIKSEIESEDYKLLNNYYENNTTPLEITCPEGHTFTTNWLRWREGYRCIECSKVKHFDKIKNSFKSEGYKLLSEDYVDAHTKLEYICPNGHKHSITWASWKQGKRCYHCRNDKNRLDYDFVKESFIKEGYTLLSDTYINSSSDLIYKCPEGHEHTTQYSRWNGGARCPSCYGNAKVKYEHIKKTIMEEGYTIISPTKKEYKNNRTRLTLLCPNEHIYYTTWGRWIANKVRCPKCNPKGTSKQEQNIIDFIDTLGIDYEVHDRYLIAPLELDITIPSKKIAIEYCGLYWHSELSGKGRKYHLNKLEACKKAGYNLITIFEDEYLNNLSIIKSRLKTLLGLGNKTIYARKCIVKEITTSEARDFIDINHIQGYTGARIKLGAYYNGELVSVMTFAVPSISKGIKNKNDYTWELSRFCSKLNYRIIGIASKFLSFFKKNFTWNTIYSYADRRWSNGKVYEAVGFQYSGTTPPNYWYFISGVCDKRIHRFALRKKPDEPKDITEWELRKKEGYNRIWDCGNMKYIMYNKRL